MSHNKSNKTTLYKRKTDLNNKWIKKITNYTPNKTSKVCVFSSFESHYHKRQMINSNACLSVA